MDDFGHSQNLLISEQFGFRPKLYQLLRVTVIIHEAFDKGPVVGVVFVSYSFLRLLTVDGSMA